MSFLDLYQGDIDQAAKIQPNEGTRLPSTFDENFHAAWSDGRLFGQSIARANARADVLGDYIDEIRQKTGNDLSKEFIPDVAGGGQTGVTDFDTANARVAKLKESYPDLDLAPLSDEEIDKRAVTKAQAAHRTYETLQQGEKTWGGSFGTFAGGAASSATDPINVLALAVAPETGGIGILSAALRWGGVAAVSQAAIEFSSNPFKEQVQPGYTESGEPIKQIGGAFLGGAVLGGTTKALGNAWTRVKTGQWPRSIRDAGNVVESETNVADTNPFPGVEGEVAHREALTKTIDDILAGRPVSVDNIITPQFLERSRSLVEKLQTEQPMALPIVNRRAIELIADEQRLSARDAELAAGLDKLPAGDASAADRLNRLQAVEQQIAEVTDPAARRKLNERRDQILVDTNPEALRAAAAPIEQRRAMESERASIADQLKGITDEHARMQAETLSPMKLPALGQSERIPTGPKGQFELDLKPPEEPNIEAYHGSAHDFDRFDLSKLHTGEGSDSFGRGFYFAEQPGTADFYSGLRGKGKIYKVRIKAGPERFIDWDKPLSEQSSVVQTFAKKLGIEGNPAGQEFQDAIARKVLTQEIEKRGGFDNFDPASIPPDMARDLPYQRMKEAGIAGTKYLDAGSRETGGTRNFVVFDDRHIEITHKNGKPVSAETTSDMIAPQPPLQTPDDMAKTLTAPDHQEAIRADIDRARAMGDVKVPGVDENGNHTMVSIDAAMEKVDAYKAAAEQIQACANPVQEAAE